MEAVKRPDQNALMAKNATWHIEGLPTPEDIFANLQRIGADVEGVTRTAYDAAEAKALDYIEELARSIGLAVGRDPATNLVLQLPSQPPQVPAIYVGSHLDSVPRGGNYDGAAGVVAGLLCLARFHATGEQPDRPVRVLALRCEESPWFGVACVGSRTLFGEIGPDLDRTHRTTGKTLRSHLAAAGAAMNEIESGRPLLSSEDVAAYYELHIEQGPVLVAHDCAVGVVSGIQGILRYSAVKCLGEEGHSGAIPRTLRRDAAAATIELLHRLNVYWNELSSAGRELVVTSGIISTNPERHSASKIAGEVTFSLDVRSMDKTLLEDVRKFILESASEIERSQGVSFQMNDYYITAPAIMNSASVRRLLRLSRQLGLPERLITSGSGHDAQVFASNGIPTSMIFVRSRNGSHNPAESMDIGDFEAATDLLFEALRQRDEDAC
jgi:N-carbamoyl-L-amino-acid hydrolase